MERLRLSLFGAFGACLDGKSIAGFQSDKTRALLTYLAVEADQGHRRQRLAGMFWPDLPEQTARTYLRNALSNLRKVIRDAENPRPHLLIEPDTINFNKDSSVWVDVLAFTSLTRKTNASIVDLENAVRLQPKPFLQGFSLEGCPEFESWVLLTQRILEQRLLTVMSQLCRQYELRGELGRAVEVAYRQISLEPFDEPILRSLLRLLALNGERSTALEQFHNYRNELAVELWVEPEEETLQLIENIKTGKLGLCENSLPTIHN